jgi:hypothetical protein
MWMKKMKYVKCVPRNLPLEKVKLIKYINNIKLYYIVTL